jgi:predicted transcriptional regulator
MSPSVLEMTKDLVSAQIQTGTLLPEDTQGALHRVFQSLLTLKSREEAKAQVSAAATGTAPAPSDWRKSITRHSVTCLECGRTCKQLSVRHLRHHDLDGRSYRAKYGIPRTQPLAAKATTALRRQIVSEIKPWEKSPTYRKRQETRAATAKKSGRKKVTRKR